MNEKVFALAGRAGVFFTSAQLPADGELMLDQPTTAPGYRVDFHSFQLGAPVAGVRRVFVAWLVTEDTEK